MLQLDVGREQVACRLTTQQSNVAQTFLHDPLQIVAGCRSVETGGLVLRPFADFLSGTGKRALYKKTLFNSWLGDAT